MPEPGRPITVISAFPSTTASAVTESAYGWPHSATRPTPGQLPEEHQQALAAIDPYWNPPWSLDWQRKYAQAKDLILADLGPDWWYKPDYHQRAGREDLKIANWIYKQRKTFFRLHEEQQDLLLRIGTPPLPDSVYTKRSDYARHVFYEGLMHLAVFLAREGHADVPRDHDEPSRWEGAKAPVYPLGAFIHRCRKHPEALTDEQRHALQALQMIWDPSLGRHKHPKPPPTG
nr:helicase associated domain-containing protein [Streptomyces violens]